MVKSLLSKGRVLSVRVRARVPKVNLEDDAGGMVRRLALKTRFSEMGWGSTPPSSAKFVSPWCNGSTAVSKTVSKSSSLLGDANVA